MSEIRAIFSIPTKILLPIDFSESSQAALDIAANLALHFSAKLFLVNVIPFFPTTAFIPFYPTTTFPDFVPEESFLRDAKDRKERHLAKCRAVLIKKGIEATTSVEVGSDVAGNIMEVVDREHIDLVVISTHGISGWHPLIFGSIAEKVIKIVQCPLLLLRSPKPDADLKTPSNRSMEWW